MKELLMIEFLNVISVVLGILLIAASKCPPNRFIGLSLKSMREDKAIWKLSNKLAGKILICLGILYFILGYVIFQMSIFSVRFSIAMFFMANLIAWISIPVYVQNKIEQGEYI